MNEKPRLSEPERTNAVLDELNRVKAIAYRLAADVAVLKGTTPYVVALSVGLLPGPAAGVDR